MLVLSGRVSIDTKPTATQATFMTLAADMEKVLWIAGVAVIVKELHTKLAKTGTVVVASLSRTPDVQGELHLHPFIIHKTRVGLVSSHAKIQYALARVVLNFSSSRSGIGLVGVGEECESMKALAIEWPVRTEEEGVMRSNYKGIDCWRWGHSWLYSAILLLRLCESVCYVCNVGNCGCGVGVQVSMVRKYNIKWRQCVFTWSVCWNTPVNVVSAYGYNMHIYLFFTFTMSWSMY